MFLICKQSAIEELEDVLFKESRKADKKKKYDLLWCRVTKKSITEFIELLEKFNPKYYSSNDNRIYRKNRELSDKLHLICKNPEFAELYRIWEKHGIKKLYEIRLSLI